MRAEVNYAFGRNFVVAMFKDNGYFFNRNDLTMEGRFGEIPGKCRICSGLGAITNTEIRENIENVHVWNQ